MRLEATLENCIFYIFTMYEFSHSLGHVWTAPALQEESDFSGEAFGCSVLRLLNVASRESLLGCLRKTVGNVMSPRRDRERRRRPNGGRQRRRVRNEETRISVHLAFVIDNATICTWAQTRATPRVNRMPGTTNGRGRSYCTQSPGSLGTTGARIRYVAC